MFEVRNRLDRGIDFTIDSLKRLPDPVRQLNVECWQLAHIAFVRSTGAEVHPAIGNSRRFPDCRGTSVELLYLRAHRMREDGHDDRDDDPGYANKDDGIPPLLARRNTAVDISELAEVMRSYLMELFE
jgi:hypothetical protein